MESNDSCPLSVLVRFLCRLRPTTTTTISAAPCRRKCQDLPPGIEVKIYRRGHRATSQCEFGLGERGMWRGHIAQGPEEQAAPPLITASPAPLANGHDTRAEGSVPGEIVFEVACASGTACPAAQRAASTPNVFRKEGEYWTIRYRGSVVHLKDGKGLRYLAQLLHYPDREFHVLDLMHLDPSAPPPENLDHLRVCDGAGMRAAATQRRLDPLLDSKAKVAYRHRLADLRENMLEAERFRDPARAERARAEIDFLIRELSAAVGLGGRDRATATAAERARVAVTLRIREVLRRLRETSPALGRYLGTSIKTGRFCSYSPTSDHPVRWTY